MFVDRIPRVGPQVGMLGTKQGASMTRRFPCFLVALLVAGAAGACSSVGDTAVRAKSDGNTADLDGAIGAGELDGAGSDVVDDSYDGNGLWETDAGDGKPWYEKKLGTIFYVAYP